MLLRIVSFSQPTLVAILDVLGWEISVHLILSAWEIFVWNPTLAVELRLKMSDTLYLMQAKLDTPMDMKHEESTPTIPKELELVKAVQEETKTLHEDITSLVKLSDGKKTTTTGLVEPPTCA